MRIRTEREVDRLDFDKGDGLVPVIAQDARTGEVLMLAWADRDALVRTLETGEVHLFSRSRRRPWHKGETSGNVLHAVSLEADCDRDAVLALVQPVGPACHTGRRTCFSAPPILAAIDDVIVARQGDRDASGYTRSLLEDRNLRLKKLGEEATELALAAAAGNEAAVAAEAADLVYHVLVACRAAGVSLADVLDELRRRRSG